MAVPCQVTKNSMQDSISKKMSRIRFCFTRWLLQAAFIIPRLMVCDRGCIYFTAAAVAVFYG
jgi:hypothetical protein